MNSSNSVRVRLPSDSFSNFHMPHPYLSNEQSAKYRFLYIERNQKPLAPEITLAVTHHDRQKQVEVKRSSRVNPHEIRLFSGCPYAVVKQGTKKNLQKNKPYKGFSRFRTDLSLVGLTCALYVLFLIMIMLHGHPFCYAAD